MRKTIGIAAVGLTLAAATWTVTASYIVCKMAGQMADFVFPWDQWWSRWGWVGHTNWWATTCVLISAIFAVIPVLAIGVLIVRLWWRQRSAPPSEPLWRDRLGNPAPDAGSRHLNQ